MKRHFKFYAHTLKGLRGATRDSRLARGITVIGVTGVIGSGKSTFVRELASGRHGRLLGGVSKDRRIKRIDADEIGRSLSLPGGAAFHRICRFYPPFAEEDGRARLRRHVFQEPRALQALERLMHPPITQAISHEMRRARHQRHRTVVLDIPLLLEKDWTPLCDVVVVVRSPAWLRRQRLFARSGLSPQAIAQIDARQWPLQKKLLFADWSVVANKIWQQTPKRRKACR
ncbi:MAG: dephospho-CoA kinase [Alphaproteobacteria bacterium]|nr:dephospho-CoA kinase [Alphaproteobacteria bacterium]